MGGGVLPVHIDLSTTHAINLRQKTDWKRMAVLTCPIYLSKITSIMNRWHYIYPLYLQLLKRKWMPWMEK